MKNNNNAPLSGVRIVEMAGIGPAPFAAMLLADMGAEIIRVDRPGGADPWTKTVIRRARRSVVANLKDAGDVASVKALIGQADAVIEGFRPGVMERLGLGPEEMIAANPKLVYGRMTGWGQDGPLAQSAGHDLGYIAITGALHAIGPKDRPVPPLNLVGDMGGGALYLAMGVLAGIVSARATGKGQVVDCAISDCTASLMAMFSDMASQGRWNVAEREANVLDGGAPFYRTYPCADGKFLAVGSLESQFYDVLCEKLGLARIDEKLRWREAEWPALEAAIGGAIATKTRDDWAGIFEGTDACVAPVLTLDEAARHAHNAARGAFVEVGGVVQPAPAPRFSNADNATPGMLPDYASLQAVLAAWR